MHAIDRFVDELLDDSLRRREHEQGVDLAIDRAADRSECRGVDLTRRPPACVRGHALALQIQRQARLGPQPSAAQRQAQQLRLSALRGACAEAHLAQRLCRAGFDVFNQARVRPRDRRSPRLDVGGMATPAPGRTGLRSGLEVKHLHLPAYLRPGTVNVDLPRLQAQVQAYARQVREQMAAVAAGGAAVRPGLPRQIRLLMQLGGLGEVRRREATLGIAPMRSDASARPMPRAAVVASRAIRSAAAAAGVPAFVVAARL